MCLTVLLCIQYTHGIGTLCEHPVGYNIECYSVCFFLIFRILSYFYFFLVLYTADWYNCIIFEEINYIYIINIFIVFIKTSIIVLWWRNIIYFYKFFFIKLYTYMYYTRIIWNVTCIIVRLEIVKFLAPSHRCISN